MADLLGTKKFLEALNKEMGVTLPLTDDALRAVTNAAAAAGVTLTTVTDLAKDADALIEAFKGTPEQTQALLRFALSLAKTGEKLMFKLSHTIDRVDHLVDSYTPSSGSLFPLTITPKEQK